MEALDLVYAHSILNMEGSIFLDIKMMYMLKIAPSSVLVLWEKVVKLVG